MKNKIEFKKVLLYITFTVLLFMILFGIIQTYQYKTYTENFNESLMSIILKLNEEYPELNASKQYLNLQKNLSKIENQLQAARRIYNIEVTNYNDAVSTFPTNFIANMFKFKEAEFFEADLDK